MAAKVRSQLPPSGVREGAVAIEMHHATLRSWLRAQMLYPPLLCFRALIVAWIPLSYDICLQLSLSDRSETSEMQNGFVPLLVSRRKRTHSLQLVRLAEAALPAVDRSPFADCPGSSLRLSYCALKDLIYQANSFTIVLHNCLLIHGWCDVLPCLCIYEVGPAVSVLERIAGDFRRHRSEPFRVRVKTHR